MPIYEYECRGCGRQFEALVNGSIKAQCPACQGDDLQRMLSVFAVGSTEKSTFNDAPAACGTCGDPRGPGSCSIN
jgi:putative FmdB family regulatory protein